MKLGNDIIEIERIRQAIERSSSLDVYKRQQWMRLSNVFYN